MKEIRTYTIMGLLLLSINAYTQNCNKFDQKEIKPIPEGVDSNTVAEGNTSVCVPCDSNEIIHTKGYDALGDTLQWMATTASLPYTVYFENDSELATAAAQKVEIHYAYNSIMN